VADFLGAAVIGSPATVAQGLNALQQATQADELMLVCDVYEPELRLRALSLAAEAVGLVDQAGTAPVTADTAAA
jgi:alkanesulfonate monooxygenase SsuD/methylene tetrahydromethanopterin reductase-like flavin-dependent oxidoreductase (luciferase family)